MSQVVKKYYENNAEKEWQRLNKPYNRIEFASTMQLIEKYFPKEGHICDVGSGPGRYAIELLQRGYRVTLFELSAKELELASTQISELGLQAEDYICENALNLHVMPSEAYDAALVMGPLYHILDAADREEVIRQTARILKPGGVAILAYINSWGTLKAGVTEFSDSFRDTEHLYAYLGEQKLGENTGFTECYFTTPPRALEEVEQGEFEVITYAGAEGFLSGMSNEVLRLYQEDRPVYDNLLRAVSETCEYPQYRDATEHLHIVVRKGKRC